MSGIEENRTAQSDVMGAAAKAPLELGRVQAVVATVVAALLVNLVIWAIGAAAGGSFEFTNVDIRQSAAPGGVVILTVVPLLIGMILAALLSYRWFGAIRVAQVVGPALALLTIVSTLLADFDGASTVALAAMHVAIAPIVVVGLEAMRRRLVRQQAAA
ncbi:MAG: DUF6069 family protein [Pseudonocardia sp.]